MGQLELKDRVEHRGLQAAQDGEETLGLVGYLEKRDRKDVREEKEEREDLNFLI